MQRANHDDCSLRTLLSLQIFCPYLQRSNSPHSCSSWIPCLQAPPPKRQDFILLRSLFRRFIFFTSQSIQHFATNLHLHHQQNLKWRSSQRPWLEFFSPLLPLNVAWTTQTWLGQRLGMDPGGWPCSWWSEAQYPFWAYIGFGNCHGLILFLCFCWKRCENSYKCWHGSEGCASKLVGLFASGTEVQKLHVIFGTLELDGFTFK